MQVVCVRHGKPFETMMSTLMLNYFETELMICKVGGYFAIVYNQIMYAYMHV
jgi:hypothetical protein